MSFSLPPADPGLQPTHAVLIVPVRPDLQAFPSSEVSQIRSNPTSHVRKPHASLRKRRRFEPLKPNTQTAPVDRRTSYLRHLLLRRNLLLRPFLRPHLSHSRRK